MKRVLAVLPWVVLGCDNDLDALYERTTRDAGAVREAGAVRDAGSGRTANVRDGGAGPKPLFWAGAVQEQCDTCVEQECGGEAHACREDDYCASIFECRGACSDPACFDRCDDQYDWPGTFTRGPVEKGLGVCVNRECAGPCQFGRHMECLRKFDWGSSFAERGSARVELFDYMTSEPVAGARVRACHAVAASCDEDFVEAEEGIAIVPFARASWSVLTEYFEIIAPGWDPVVMYQAKAPVASVVIVAPMVPPDYYEASFALAGEMDDPKLGGVWATMNDCVTTNAPDLSLRVSPDTAGSKTWYTATGDLNKTKTTSDGIAGVALLAPGLVEVTAVRAGTDEVVARARVLIRAGTRTWVVLPPLSASDE